MIQTNIYNEEDMDLLGKCTLCPRRCLVNRFEAGTGYCSSDAGMNVASVCLHKGEEPSISGTVGICNIFFSGCNLRCVYCQNHEISRSVSLPMRVPMDLQDVIAAVATILDKGINRVGFVSPSHVVPQVKVIIRVLNDRGYKPVTVYNTNSYDRPETIKELEGMIDVYLPDLKYVTPEIAKEYSDTDDYPEVALAAIKEMYYQKGSALLTGAGGLAERGMLIRHLVLPGHAEESRKVLRKIADELSTGVHISLMSQYHPVNLVRDHHLLSRHLYKEEYDSVVREMEALGFRNGWVQDMDSFQNYRPDFSSDHPFEY